MNDSEDSTLASAPMASVAAMSDESQSDPHEATLVRSILSTSTLVPDQLVGGRYRIIGLLGQGAMGEVYEAEDNLLEERVALKVLRPEFAGDPASIERFLQEVRLARRINHPNVCRVFDTGIDRHQQPGQPPHERYFFTMELLDGETLSHRLRRKGRLTTTQALILVRQMAEALGAAHAAGVVHRDFKCENVLLVRAPSGGGIRVVVMDFGLARSFRNGKGNSTSNNFAGTPAYMAPEQVEGGDITPAADVYALGVVIYEMVTGELPFTGDNALVIAHRRLTDPPTPPRSHVPDLDPRWEVIILKCLARQPAQRFLNGTAVRDVLPLPELPSGEQQGPRVPWDENVYGPWELEEVDEAPAVDPSLLPWESEGLQKPPANQEGPSPVWEDVALDADEA